jgi:hypothetical protein
MRKSTMMMAATGLIATVLMMVMSGVYLSQLPTAKELAVLGDQLTEQSQVFLDPSTKVDVKFEAPTEQKPGSIALKCQLKRRFAGDRATVERLFHRLADTVLYHPLWMRHTRTVTVTQVGVDKPMSVTKERVKKGRSGGQRNVSGDSKERVKPVTRADADAVTVSGKKPAPKVRQATGSK